MFLRRTTEKETNLLHLPTQGSKRMDSRKSHPLPKPDRLLVLKSHRKHYHNVGEGPGYLSEDCLLPGRKRKGWTGGGPLHYIRTVLGCVGKVFRVLSTPFMTVLISEDSLTTKKELEWMKTRQEIRT